MLTMRRISLVLLICLFSGTAYSNPPTPAPPNTEQKNQTDPKDKQQPPSPDQRGSETSPLIKVIPPLPVEQDSTKEHDNGRSYTSSEWWLVYITFALVLATVGLMVYTARLWGATKSLAQDAKKTADRQASEMETSLRIAQESADAAKKSSEAAERTVNIMKETAERQLRAYVITEGVDLVNVTQSSGVIEPWIHIKFKNSGQIPATRLMYFVVICTAPVPLRGALIGKNVPQRIGVIPPHDTFTAKMNIALMDHPNEHTALYVYGEIYYFLSSNSKCNTTGPDGLRCCHDKEILSTHECRRP